MKRSIPCGAALVGLNCMPNVLPLRMQKLKLSIRTDDGGHGRTTILGTHLKAFGKEGDLVSEREVQNVHELKEVLEAHFGIIP